VLLLCLYCTVIGTIVNSYLSYFKRFQIFYLGVNPTLYLVIVKHNTSVVNRDIVCGCCVNPTDLASRSANCDIGGGIDAADEVLKVSHNFLP
jgi:hypothetical protein